MKQVGNAECGVRVLAHGHENNRLSRAGVGKLCRAITILSDALSGPDIFMSGPPRGADGFLPSVCLADAENRALTALLTGELGKHGVQRSSLTHGTREDLTRWIEILADKVGSPRKEGA